MNVPMNKSDYDLSFARVCCARVCTFVNMCVNNINKTTQLHKVDD